jgi:hypothetical protein
MTRTEAIATLTAAVAQADDAKLAAITAAVAELSKLDTETVLTVGDVIRDMKVGEPPLRSLTPRERDLIARSKADFAAGRTYSTEEVFNYIDARAAARRASRDNA